MLQEKKNFERSNYLVILALAVSLAACSTGTQNNTESTTPDISPSPQASSPSTQAADVQASVSIPGVNNVEEVNFKTPATNAPTGSFDAVNGSSALNHEITKAVPIKAGGWAILADERRPADMVIITSGENNSLVAVAPVNFERQDVGKVLKNPIYNKAGWNVTFNSSSLPAGKTTLKAWAYNSAKKEATQLAKTHEVDVTE